MILSEIPKLVINLPERSDRLESFKGEVEHIGGDYRVVNGIVMKFPREGIMEAHKLCITMAKINNWPNVMIMEDDVLFQAKGKTIEYVTNALREAPADFDVLLGGIYEGKPQKFNDYWNKVGQFCGLHCYIVSERFYDKFLNLSGPHHIDRLINMRGENKCYVSKKFFAIQRPGYSDQIKGEVNYEHKLQKFELL